MQQKDKKLLLPSCLYNVREENKPRGALHAASTKNPQTIKHYAPDTLSFRTRTVVRVHQSASSGFSSLCTLFIWIFANDDVTQKMLRPFTRNNNNFTKLNHSHHQAQYYKQQNSSSLLTLMIIRIVLQCLHLCCTALNVLRYCLLLY